MLGMSKKKKKTVSKTYEEWNKDGYYIIKGMKSNERNEDGVASFTEEQVKRKRTIYDFFMDY
jgi:hypothetical protein